MRKIVIVLLLVATSLFAKAQDGLTYLGLRTGWVAEKGFTATLNLDFSLKYFSSFEVFTEYYKNYNTKYNTVMGGAVYKPALIRNRNSLVKMRLGVGTGVGREEFLIAPQIGWEFSQSILNNIDFVFVNRNQYVFFDRKPDQLRIGFDIGLRLPL